MATVKYNLGTVGGIAVTELWSGSVGNLTSQATYKITLNDDLTNYKFLIFDFWCTVNGDMSTRRCFSRFVSVQQFINLFNSAVASTTLVFCWGLNNINDFFVINKDSTTKVLNAMSMYTQCLRIVGIN